MKLRQVMLAAVLVFIVSSCGKTVGQAEVEVDLLSGQPNPTWALAAEEIDEMTSLIEQLPADHSAESSKEIVLGFRGFIIRGLTLPDIDEDHSIIVLSERVIIETNVLMMGASAGFALPRVLLQ
ncbi:hypothetical protein [Halalkalibacterium halodurans]|uniref:hypothetical protein n=1 Tax=Halalkalibacterium halodurans TaxID=86665 RepID=UPI002AA9B468|nr:hypothetical protein [Halalkalibacterium halodurans]MDY7221522.1 hypothetical protein [Halalkalibacterium halodurans]MDY7240798.1 hypothetical protein [Halalkalibacterium halodurans]MED4125608.1 hypothetical protein [Halalkalibacterium halodurans]